MYCTSVSALLLCKSHGADCKACDKQEGREGGRGWRRGGEGIVRGGGTCFGVNVLVCCVIFNSETATLGTRTGRKKERGQRKRRNNLAD